MTAGDRTQIALQGDLDSTQGEVDNHEMRITNLEGSKSAYSKSVVIDIKDSQGDGSFVGIRSISFSLGGVELGLTPDDYTTYATSTASSSYSSDYIFDTTLSKTGTSLNTSWETASGNATEQRVIIVFNDDDINFDSMVINNYHSSGSICSRGANNVVMYSSVDEILDLTYGAEVFNSQIIFDGVFKEHLPIDQEEDQEEPVNLVDISISTRVSNIEEQVTDAGIIGRKTAASTGYVGEVKMDTSYASSKTYTGNTNYSLASVTLSEGVWMIVGNIFIDDNESISGYKKVMIDDSTVSWSQYYTAQSYPNYGENDFGIVAPTQCFTVTESTTYYLWYKCETTMSTGCFSRIQAVRVA